MHGHSSNAWAVSPVCEAAAINFCLECASVSHCFTVCSTRSFVSCFHWNTTLFHAHFVAAEPNTCCWYEHRPCKQAVAHVHIKTMQTDTAIHERTRRASHRVPCPLCNRTVRIWLRWYYHSLIKGLRREKELVPLFSFKHRELM